ncbi:hypothetical protein [Spiroplasma phoeniceum]|nr:hypothetical protein [Spiroplasma phoeniceum]
MLLPLTFIVNFCANSTIIADSPAKSSVVPMVIFPSTTVTCAHFIVFKSSSRVFVNKCNVKYSLSIKIPSLRWAIWLVESGTVVTSKHSCKWSGRKFPYLSARSKP